MPKVLTVDCVCTRITGGVDIDSETIKQAVERMLKESPERKFLESIDIAVGLKDVNLKDPSKRFRSEIVLPHKPHSEIKIAVVGDEAARQKAKDAAIPVILSPDDVEKIGKDPKEARKFSKGIDYVLAIPQMMGIVGKNLGRYLGPVGKTPSVIPPNADLSDLATRYQRTCKVRLRQSPVLHAKVATRDMNVDEIVENIEVVLREIENKLEQGEKNVKNLYIKTTMGPAILVGGK